LDSELRAHIKGNDPTFEISKLAFFSEATGAVQEGHILEAQSAVANARRSSLQAGFNLFKTSLDNDQVLHDRHLQASKTDEAKARSAALGSLEAGWVYTKKNLCHLFFIFVC
jgi:acyl-CoA hydrolase